MYQNFSNSQGSYHGTHNNYYSPPSNESSSSATSTSSSRNNLMSRMNESAATALLQHLDKDELQHLLDNDSKMKDLIDDLPQVRSLQTEHDDLVATNKSLAEYNLSLQPRIENLKQYVASEYEQVNGLKTELAQNKARLDTFVGQQSLDTMLALLQTETAKTEEESEEYADKFCEGNMATEEFLNQYLPKRTLAHLRRIKSERFAELIRDSHSGSSSHNSNTANNWGSSSNSASSYQNSSAVPPYPTSGFGMPQLNFPR